MGNVRPTDSKIDHEGLVTGSNADGLRHAQRAYVHVSRTGIVESVVSSLARGAASKFIELPRISDYIVKYAQLYAASLNSCGIAAPVAIVASLVGVKDMRLVQDFIANVIAEDLPFGALHEDSVHFGEVIFETVPAEYNESAKTLRPLLNHMANAAALPSSPYFDADGNYTLKVRQGL